MKILDRHFIRRWAIPVMLGILAVGVQTVPKAVPPAYAQGGTGTIRVDAAGGTDTAGCGSAATPCKTLQYAAGQSASGDTLKLAAGTYTGTGSEVVRFDGFAQTVTIAGGYTTSNWNTADPAGNPTIIDGGNSRRGVYIDGWTGSTVINLQGLTIQNARMSGNHIEVYGGGLYCVNSATVSLDTVLFKNNTVQSDPGTIYTVVGGGAAFFGCSVTMQNVTFDGNRVLGADASPRGGQARGGGFFSTAGTVINGSNVTAINNTVTAGNSTGSGISGDGEVAQSFGGGFDIGVGSTVNLTNIDVRNNVSQAGNGATYGGFGSGGGVFIEGYPGSPSTVTLTGGKISNNQAIGGNGNGTKNGYGGATGGGLMAGGTASGGPNVTLNQLEIIGNTAQGGVAANASGGAIYLQAAGGFTGNNLIIANNTITPGAGGVGTGGAFEVGSNVARSLTLNYSTIANNNVTLPAVGNVISIFGSPTTFYFNDSIIANHTDKPAAAFLGGSGHAVVVNRSLWYNNNATKFSGSGGTVVENSPVTPGDPKFASIAGNDFHITSSSAAIDKSTAATVTEDIDGNSRPQGAAFDVGADEYAPALALSTKTASPTSLYAADGPNHTVNYTILIKNGSAQSVSATLVDPLPSPGAPVSANLTSGPNCSAGICNFDGRNVNWSGSVGANSQVTLTYQMTFNFSTGYLDTVAAPNVATLSYTDGGQAINAQLSNTVIINPKLTYLPILMK